MKPGDDRELDRRHHEHRLAGRRLRAQDGQRDRLGDAPRPDAADRARLRRLERPPRPTARSAPSVYSGTVSGLTNSLARQLRRRHQAPLQVHGHDAAEHERHVPGPHGRRRLRLVGHPVLVTGTHVREGSAVSGGRALPWVLHCALSKEAPMSLSSTLPLARRGFGVLLAGAALILALAVLVPALLGYQRYVITSGSMTGTYDRGSLVFDKVVPSSEPARQRRHHLPPARARRAGHAPHPQPDRGRRPARADAPRATPTARPTPGARSPRRRAAGARRLHRPTSATGSPSLSEKRVRCSSSASPRCSSP